VPLLELGMLAEEAGLDPTAEVAKVVGTEAGHEEAGGC
jgi:hypothetical protein